MPLLSPHCHVRFAPYPLVDDVSNYPYLYLPSVVQPFQEVWHVDSTDSLDNSLFLLYYHQLMAPMTTVHCPHCGKSFGLSLQKDPWKALIGKLLQPFCMTTTPAATRGLIQRGIQLGLWTSYPGGHRRLRQMEAEGFIDQLDHGWWGIRLAGRDLAAKQPDKGPLQEIPGLPDPPPESPVGDLVPTPTRELLYFLREFVDFPHLRSINKVARYSIACGFLEKRGAAAKVRSLIANGYLQWIGGQLQLTSSTKRILAREFPSMNRALRVNDQPPPTD